MDAILSNLIDQLNDLFIYKDKQLTYNEQVQEKSNELLQNVALLTDTYTKNIKKERKNIEEELTIVDKITGEKKQLVDIDSMEYRVAHVLNNNNIYTCLKSLALSNKCAHSFDGNLHSIRAIFIHYYNILYPDEIVTEKKLTFFEDINSLFPNISNNSYYNLNNIDDDTFKKIYEALCSSNNSKGQKIKILRQLSMVFDVKNDEDIDKKFEDLRNDSVVLINSFLLKKYHEGMYIVEQQDKLFAIKDKYISMIGQLLKKRELKNIKYELIKTKGSTPGFEYMLIIDDPELSYYVEVHMPNFIAYSLIKKYGLKYSAKRTTQPLGASAVYKRDRNEVKEIRKKLQKKSIIKGRIRAQIIARGANQIEETSEGEKQTCTIDNDARNQKKPGKYRFVTDEIVDTSSLFEEYLNDKQIYLKEIEKNKYIRLNENYSQNITKKIVYSNYLKIYYSFSHYEKENFIIYALEKLNHGDSFDRTLCNKIKDKLALYDLDILARIMIYHIELKKYFVNLLKKYKRSQKLVNVDLLMDKYIEKYIKQEINRKGDENGSKRKK